MLRSQLTKAEVEIASTECIDLGAGYPTTPRTPEILDLWDRSFHQAIRDDLTAQSRRKATEDVIASVLHFLGLDQRVLKCSMMATGSAALDVAIRAAVEPGKTVVMGSPIIDLVPSMVTGLRSSSMTVVQPMTGGMRIDYAQVAGTVRRSKPGACVVVSPVNPTGQLATRDELADLASACASVGAVLVADQCFSAVSPWGRDVPHVAHLQENFPELDWLEVWDTGKTFGLNDMKIGFVICSPRLADRVEKQLQIIQFDLPHVTKLLFRSLLDDGALIQEILRYNHAAVLENLTQLQRFAPSWSLTVPTPDAGNLAMTIADSKTSLGQHQSHRRLLLEARVGVVNGATFLFSRTGRPRTVSGRKLLRFALARDPAYFLRGLERIDSWIANAG